MTSLVPGWAQEGGAAALAKRLQDPAMRAKIRAGMVPNLERRAGAHALMIRSFAPDPSLEGKRLDEVGRIKGMDPLDAAIEMLIAGGAPTISFNMSDADVEAFMRQPWTRSEEHPSELQSLMRTSYAVFCLKKKTTPLASA